MKTKEIASKYNFDRAAFETYLKNSKFRAKDGLMGMTLEDADVDMAVTAYKQYVADKKAAETASEIAAQEARRRMEEAIKKMIVTNAPGVEGYKIARYRAYIDTCAVIAYKDNLQNAIETARRQAVRGLQEKAYACDCNAIVAIRFETVLDGNVSGHIKDGSGTIAAAPRVAVSATANAVVIETADE